ncbi:MAG: hypothetical protein Q9167_001337 [Letrouitia subvulpina]
MQFPSAVLILAATFMVSTNALNIPREAAPLPEPAGCSGQSYRDPDQAKAVAACKAACTTGCIAPFYNGGYWYSPRDPSRTQDLENLRALIGDVKGHVSNTYLYMR